MTFDNLTPYKGNIETSQREVKPVGALLKCGSVELDFDELDGSIKITPAQFVASDVNYDYESITRKKLRNVNLYKIQWEIEFSFLSKATLQNVKKFEEFWERSGHVFDSSGVRYNKRVFFTPEGQEGTVPTFEVVKISSFTLNPGYYADRLIGHSNVKWVIETVEEFKNKRMRVKVAPDFLVPDSGELTWGGFISVGKVI